ncbi:bile acid:sodium symporter family protein [Natrinema salsiterrestre]|uniref:Sodium symporter n=1 Tax=Natrinema salsiterrestre TaxID=2950540 RepID=A0A9Q4L8C9_9EURY|nr:sodium symporter [Natrinema salsiterrestre]MDF9747845.1 sodium symporter [Natrinema salsiterrestre]
MLGISNAVIVETATTVFVLSTMLSMGLELSITQLLEPFRKRRLVAKSLLVNVLAIPLAAYLFVRMLTISRGYEVGIILIAVAPGAPFGPKLAEISRSDIAFASGLVVVLGLASAATIPVSLLLLLPGSVSVDPFAIGQMVFGIQVLPLLIGICLTSRYATLADRLYPPIQRLSNHSFGILLVLLSVVYFDRIVSLLGTGTLFVSVSVVGASLLLGYAFGGPMQNRREVLATTTAARNAAIALFIATTSFRDPDVLTVVLAFSFISVLGSGLLAAAWRGRTADP